MLQQLRQGLEPGRCLHRLDEQRKHLLLHSGGPHRSGPHPRSQELAALEEANGYHDTVLDVGEVFGVWVIEGPAGWRTSCRSRRPA